MKLTDTQAIILNAAAQRDRLVALPLSPSLRGGAATKVVTAMVSKGLIATVPARGDDPVWDDTDDGAALTLVATDDGLAAIGLCNADGQPCDVHSDSADGPDAETAPSTMPEPSMDARKGNAARKPRASRKAAQCAPTPTDRAKAATTRPGTKQVALIAMLRRPEGASITEIADTFGWLPHTARGAVSGALRKKLGLDVQSERVAERGTVYRLLAEG